MRKDSYEAAYILLIVIGLLGAANIVMYASSANVSNSNPVNGSTLSTVPSSGVGFNLTLNGTTVSTVLTTSTIIQNTTSTIIQNATNTINATANTTIPTTSILQNQSVAPAVNFTNLTRRVPRLGMIRPGFAKGVIQVRDSNASLNLSSGSVLSTVMVHFKKGIAPSRFNISILNQSQTLGFRPPKNRVYQYIQINESQYNSTQSIDPEISNVTYNFTVSSGWIQQQNIDPGTITLLKYLSGSWVNLPTAIIGQNATSYQYTAISNSFSTYAISFTTINTVGTGNVLITVPSGGLATGTSYFFAGASNTVPSATVPSARWSITSCTIIVSASNVLYAAVGYNAITGTTSYNSIGSNNVAAGFGANVIVGTAGSRFYSGNTASTRASSLIVVFNSLTANSYVVITSAISNSLFSGFTSNAAGGAIVQSQNGLAAWAGIMVFNSLAPGSYSVTTTATGATGLIATTAFVFSPYSVTFNSLPSNAIILTNGINYGNPGLSTGNTIQLFGTGTINAIAPPAPANFVFYSWGTNTVNAIIASPTSQNTVLTIMNNAIITASWNGITKFFWAGLPSGATWNVVYNAPLINSSSTSNAFILFKTANNVGSPAYSVNSQIASSTGNFFSYQYVPTPAAGTIQAGNGVVVTFAPAIYATTLNDLPNTATVLSNGITWANNGLMKVSGTGAINAIVPPAPSNFIFYSWTSNNINGIITTATSQNTMLTVLGNTLITAEFNGISKFFWSGLPTATTWNVVYGTTLNSSSTSNTFISFLTSDNAGSVAYSVNSQLATTVGTGNYFSYVYAPSLASGTLQSGNGVVVSFAPTYYSVTLNDLPQTENIISNGITWGNNGLMTVSGTGAINAINIGPANYVFSSWTANNVNAIFTSATSANTLVTILGNTLITANFNAITNFTETGLPAGTTWNVIYNGITVTNSIIPLNAIVTFNTIWWGMSTYSIPNQVIGPTTYVASPNSGSLGAGNTILITFTPSSCAISLSNSVVNFGSLAPGTLSSTTNVVVDTNSGSSPSAIWVYGGNWIGTIYSFFVTNTLWNGGGGLGVGNALTNIAVNTLMIAPAGGSNTIYLGANVPIGQPADTYTQNVVIENVC